MSVQIEATDAINNMYNFKFDSAEVQFNKLKIKYSHHPLPYFLFGLMEYWKIMPNDNVKDYDEKFYAYMDSTIKKGEALLDKNDNNVEAAFFLSAAYGFKGRLLSERGSWTKATFAGKNALKYLQKSKEKDGLGPEFVFGDGLYNYYAIWIPENYKILKPILAMFPKGDKVKGIEQLKETANNAFYTRVEAQTYLMRIYENEENKADLAYPISKYLYETYPDNPFFLRYFVKTTYVLNKNEEAEKACKILYDRVIAKLPFYEAVAGRYACFILGYYARFRHADKVKAKEYFLKAIEFSESVKQTSMGYCLYSIEYLAQMADEEKDIELAKTYYRKVKEYADSDHITYANAKKYLKEH
jgi:hypothetical protein